MKKQTEDKLRTAMNYCDENDKSTEFMIEYMKDVANVDLDCVLSFIQRTTDEQRKEYRNIKLIRLPRSKAS